MSARWKARLRLIERCVIVFGIAITGVRATLALWPLDALLAILTSWVFIFSGITVAISPYDDATSRPTDGERG